MTDDLIKEMRELIKAGRKEGKILSVDEAFKKYPAEWRLIDGKPVHIDDLPEMGV